MSKTSKFAEMRRTHQEWEAFASELESELSAVMAERDVLAAALKKARERIKYQDPKILGMQEIDDTLSAINQQELTSPTGSEVANERHANERIATLKEALVVAAKDAAAWQANALEMERERDEARAELSRKRIAHESTRNFAKRKSSEAIAFKEQRDALATAVDAAIECGIVPKVGTPTAGAAYYERQNDVADMLRDALVKSKGGKP